MKRFMTPTKLGMDPEAVQHTLPAVMETHTLQFFLHILQGALLRAHIGIVLPVVAAPRSSSGTHDRLSPSIFASHRETYTKCDEESRYEKTAAHHDDYTKYIYV